MKISDSVSHLYPHPFNKPAGAGTGWEISTPAEATMWTVENRDGLVIGSHPTEAAAQRQIDGLYAAEIFANLETALAEAERCNSISNRQFALFRMGDDEWRAEAGNPRPIMSLGEMSGEVEAQGTTAISAVAALVIALADAPVLPEPAI